jgi:hypothetical protein
MFTHHIAPVSLDILKRNLVYCHFRVTFYLDAWIDANNLSALAEGEDQAVGW